MTARLLVCGLALALLMSGCGTTPSRSGVTQHIAHAIGCTKPSTPRGTGHVSQETCTLGTDRLSIWSFTQKPAQVPPLPVWVRDVLAGPGWYVGCTRITDCTRAQRVIGGLLTKPATSPTRSRA